MNFGLEETLKYLPTAERESLLRSIMEDKVVHCCYLNQSKISIEDFLKQYPNVKAHPFVKGAFIYSKEEYDLGKSILHSAGGIYIQDPSSMMPVYFLNPKKGDRIIDLCAAPGGKTIDAALALQGSGLVVSNDISYPRAKELSSNIERLGLGNVIVSSVPPASLSEAYPHSFDKVILDAPCSGSAMFRKNSLAKEDWTLEKVNSCAALQLKLLEEAYILVRKGGAIAYSTCSFSYEENEGVVKAFLAKHPDIKPRRLIDHPSFYKSEDCPEGIHFFPSRFEGEGQFLIIFDKDGEEEVPSHNERKSNPEVKKHLDFLKNWNLENRYTCLRGDTLYSLPCYFDCGKLSVLRYGVALLNVKDKAGVPDFALSHYLPSSISIPLNKEQAKKYLIGEAFPLSGKDGFQVVSYNALNLGFVKIVKGMAKNHFPKGLRHRY